MLTATSAAHPTRSNAPPSYGRFRTRCASSLARRFAGGSPLPSASTKPILNQVDHLPLPIGARRSVPHQIPPMLPGKGPRTGRLGNRPSVDQPEPGLVAVDAEQSALARAPTPNWASTLTPATGRIGSSSRDTLEPVRGRRTTLLSAVPRPLDAIPFIGAFLALAAGGGIRVVGPEALRPGGTAAGRRRGSRRTALPPWRLRFACSGWREGPVPLGRAVVIGRSVSVDNSHVRLHAGQSARRRIDSSTSADSRGDVAAAAVEPSRTTSTAVRRRRPAVATGRHRLGLRHAPQAGVASAGGADVVGTIAD
jgi:hypothetical protein